MIKHIVMWKLRESAEGAERATNILKAREKLESCKGIVPGMQVFDVILASPGLESTADIMLYSVFDDEAALHAYQTHPDHQAILPFMRAVVEARQCVDSRA